MFPPDMLQMFIQTNFKISDACFVQLGIKSISKNT